MTPPKRTMLDRLKRLGGTTPTPVMDTPMHGKNNSDEKTSPVNRDKMANEATRVIDDPGLPPQPGPVARPPLPPPPPAPPPAADFGLVAQRQPLHETRVESAEPRTRFIGAYASEPAPATPDKKMTPHAHALPQIVKV